MKNINPSLTSLGIEFGSTRIKAVLIDEEFSPIASGAYEWENRFENGFWTYSLGEITTGLQGAYAAMCKDFENKFGFKPTAFGSMGISAMMHGYLAFDENDNLLVPFRTWRNTTTAAAAEELTELFGFNIPQRWSIAHLYQAILNGEEHVSRIACITTLAGYVHYKLTGERTVGVGEAAGMFPLDESGAYDKAMLEKFDRLSEKHGFTKRAAELLPSIKFAGEDGGVLTAEGSLMLDPTGTLAAGVPLCPPEGDAGTGMTATNSVLPRTGNVSAGTSIFSMLVLERPLKGVYSEIDVVATPDGKPAAMVHCNNCCSELDVWVKLFEEFSALSGSKMSRSDIYELLYKNALNGDGDCGGVVAYNFLSGEPVAHCGQGAPMYLRTADSRLSLANFMRAQLYSAFASLRLGMEILSEKENIPSDKFTGHGGLFKVKGVAQQFLADALNADVSVMKTAGEGGAWGMALLAAFMRCADGRTLPAWLSECVFNKQEIDTLSPTAEGADGFTSFMNRYKQGIPAERAAAAVQG